MKTYQRRPLSPEDDAEILRLHRDRVPIRQMVALTGRSRTFLTDRVKVLGLNTPPPGPVEDLPGEVWSEARRYGVRVSTLGRVVRTVGPQSGRLLVVRLRDGYKSVLLNKRQTDLRHLLLDAFGDRDWDFLPRRLQVVNCGRSGKKGGAGGWRTEAIAGSIPKTNEVWSAAAAVVPSGLAYDLRYDLISDMVLMRLEGDQRGFPELFKTARREHSQRTGRFVEKSAFDFVSGHERTQLIDTFTDGDSF